MRTIALTGATGNIGRAVRDRMEADGDRVIGVARHDAEVLADLSTAEGRLTMVDAMREASDGVLDGVVAGAGVMAGHEALVQLNYFGAIATLRGLRPLLAAGSSPSAIAISSSSASAQPGIPEKLAELCLAEEEAAAIELAASDPVGGYAAVKLAVSRWVRREATRPEWVGEGIRLNAVAAGLVWPPTRDDELYDIFKSGGAFWIPMGRAATPAEVADLIAYLLSPAAAYFCGANVVMDGGTEAAFRADDWPSVRLR